MDEIKKPIPIFKLCMISLIVICFVSVGFFMYSQSLPLTGKIISCDKVVIITDKYQKSVDNHIINILVVNGYEYYFVPGLTFDNGNAEFEQIPIGITGMMENVWVEKTWISNFQQLNVTPSSDSKCVNCCVVT